MLCKMVIYLLSGREMAEVRNDLMKLIFKVMQRKLLTSLVVDLVASVCLALFMIPVP